MKLAEVFQKRLVLVSGKGGVGKTTVSILLALLAAKQKMRTLIVEMNSSGRVASVFNTTCVDHQEIPLAPYISSINLSPKKCFEEYVMKHIRFKSIYQAFFDNKFVSNFLDAIPGLNDVLMLGKIFELERQKKNKLFSQPAYDFIIVDAPATGHSLSTLEVPNVLQSATKIGPLHKHATSILELLGHEEKTIFCLVTLAEEMPVCESVEYIDALKQKTRLHFGPIFINSVMPQVQNIKLAQSSPETELIDNYYNLARQRYELNQHYIEDINKKFPGFEKVIIPFQFHETSRAQDLSSMINHLQETYF